MPANPKNAAVYKQLSQNMRDGLKNIYQQATTDTGAPTDALFSEANGQLDEVIRTTETAAMTIMEIVERQQEQAALAAKIISCLQERYGASAELAKLAEINAQRSEALTTLMTTLSFQDITGQRIKKVMGALKAIEESVLELYLASGLVMEGAEKEPEKEAGTLQEEAQKAVEDFRNSRKGSELKGPDKNAPSQAAIDDMLAQLGL